MFNNLNYNQFVEVAQSMLTSCTHCHKDYITAGVPLPFICLACREDVTEVEG